MQVDLIKLNTSGIVQFDDEVSCENIGYDLIKEVKNLHASGTIIDNGTNSYKLDMTIVGSIVLYSSINSSDVEFPINIKYNDYVENLVENYKISSNRLDIFPIIWENVLLEVPISASNEGDVYPSTSGDGWEIINS